MWREIFELIWSILVLERIVLNLVQDWRWIICPLTIHLFRYLGDNRFTVPDAHSNEPTSVSLVGSNRSLGVISSKFCPAFDERLELICALFLEHCRLDASSLSESRCKLTSWPSSQIGSLIIGSSWLQLAGDILVVEFSMASDA